MRVIDLSPEVTSKINTILAEEGLIGEFRVVRLAPSDKLKKHNLLKPVSLAFNAWYVTNPTQGTRYVIDGDIRDYDKSVTYLTTVIGATQKSAEDFMRRIPHLDNWRDNTYLNMSEDFKPDYWDPKLI